MRADKLKGNGILIRAMILGFPGMAKTGMVAALANMGYKIRVLDYDGNEEPLLLYTKPECLKNIDIVHFEDQIRQSERYAEVSGTPSAFVKGLKLMERWKYKEDDGTEVDLGNPDDWDSDTVVVLDSGTRMGDAAMRRVMALNNKTEGQVTDAIWGTAMKQQDAFIERLTAKRNKFHVIVIFHKKIVKPNLPRKGEDDTTTKVKEELADLIPSRYYPSALGQQLAMNIASRFPIVIESDTETFQGKDRRIIRVVPRPELDLKLPSLNVAKFHGMKVEDEPLAKLFAELAPPLSGNSAKVVG